MPSPLPLSPPAVVVVATAVTLATAAWWWWVHQAHKFGRPSSDPETYAFFHPYASGGGGGERVLWKMIQILQQQQQQGGPEHEQGQPPPPPSGREIVIYTVDPPETDEADLRRDAEIRFDVRIPHPIRLVSLEKHRDCLRPHPRLSLLMESIGTMQLARHALLESSSSRPPDVFCDTTGCAFTFAVVRWMSPRTRILAYVHYPTISTDMMLWEWKKQPSEGDSHGPNSAWLLLKMLLRRLRTCIKLVYYWMFAVLYGSVGSLADLVLVNSTWTYNHIAMLWRFCPQDIQIVYPPCRVPGRIDDSAKGDDTVNNGSNAEREPTIVSIGQFRPEKDHALQVEALSRLLKGHPEMSKPSLSGPAVRLLLIGGCRNDADRGRVDALRRLVSDRGLHDHVTFSINPPYGELQAAMATASVGIHTMRQEHFGIGVVEMMAAGLLVVAHDSGGPKSDIVTPGVTGFLATTAEEYAECLHRALTMDRASAKAMRADARASATRFSDEAFDARMGQVLPLLFATTTRRRR